MNYLSDISNIELSKIDWNFVNLENEGVYRFHWYPATFLAALPGTLIPLLSTGDDVVLDPFCGVGTTGVEAIRLGRRFIGIDSNPTAILISKAKLSFPNTHRLRDEWGTLQVGSLFKNSANLQDMRHPSEEELLDWYHPDTYQELLSILLAIRECKDHRIRTAAQAAFSSILKSVSSQFRHWGWVCDNVKPRRSEIKYKEAVVAFTAAIHSLSDGMDRITSDMTARGVSGTLREMRGRCELFCSDSVQHMCNMTEHSVDLIVTSPPYYGVADYVKSQRLSFLWFDKAILDIEGYSTCDFEALRQREAGCRSYRRRPTSLSAYMDFMYAFLVAARRVLKPGARLCLIIGESKAREGTLDALHEHATALGFCCSFRSSREIRETRRRLMAKVPSEEILVYVSPR